jgi:DNA repair ATPase RecN
MHPEAIIFFGGVFATVLTAIVTLGPVGRAFADRLRSKGAVAPFAEVHEQLDEVLTRLEDVQKQLGDLAERQDFTERLLARARERGLLEAPK